METARKTRGDFGGIKCETETHKVICHHTAQCVGVQVS